MKYQLMCLHDAAAKIYYAPFIAPHIQVGIRSFKDMCNNKQTDQGRHPQDFTLFHIGVFDDETGKVEQFDQHQSLGNGVQHQTKEG